MFGASSWSWCEVGSGSELVSVGPVSKLNVGASAEAPPLTLPVEVAAVQQVAVRGPDIPVKRGILRLQARESNRGLVEEQLQAGAALTVIQDEEQVGGVRDDAAAPENSTCKTRQQR